MNSKVIIFSPSYGIWGGGQIYIEQLCNYMNTEGVESYIVTAEPKAFDCPTKEMENVLSKKKRLLSSTKIAKEYRKEGFDTVILNDLASLWLAPVFKFYGYKVLSLLHLYLRKKEGERLGHSSLEYYLLIFSAKFCDRIFSVNRNNQKVFGTDKVTFLGNYVPDWFIDAPENNADKMYDFVLISRFSKEKNIPLFLSLLKRLSEHAQKDYKALLVGEGPEREGIMKQISDTGLSPYVDVEAWAARNKLPEIYDRGKCFVISSYHEGFATTLLEAHARGLPAIVTKSSGFCVDFVEGFGDRTGLVFSPDDLDDPLFYEKVTELLESYADYKARCLKKAKVFSEENVLGPIVEAVLQVRGTALAL